MFTFLAEDPDDGTNGQIRFFLNNFNDAFTLEEDTGFLYVPRNASIDYEQITSYQVMLGIDT